MAVVLRCSVCRRKFAWKTSEDPPEFCPFDDCHSRVASDRADDDVVMPNILHHRTKNTDKVYRDMERGSEFRAHAAANQLGVPVSEMSGLKITDLNDRRDAEVAAIPVNNPVSQMMQANPSAVGFQSAAGLAYSGAVMQGPSPNVGARTRTAIQASHREMVAKHAIGIDQHGRPAMPNLDVISERPAKETESPLYRRRG